MARAASTPTDPSTVSLSDLLAPARVRLVHAADREAVLHAAAGLLACDEAGAGLLHASLLEREHLCSTAIGHGIAIPHGRAAALKAPRGALFRLRAAVDFAAPDMQPVDLVFAMAIPEDAADAWLDLLSELAAHFSDPGFRATLRSAPDAEALLAAFRTPHRQAAA